MVEVAEGETAFEIPYLVIIAIAIIAGLFFLPLELAHRLFLLMGALLTLTMLLVGEGLKSFILPAFLLQTGAGSLLLGIPIIARPAMLVMPESTVVVGTIAEEVMRIASYKWFVYYGVWLGVLGSSITFAIMHVFWFGWEEKLFAIAAGAILSLMLGIFKSETACIATHLAFNLRGFGYMADWQYIAIAGVLIIAGFLLTRGM